LTPIKQIPIGSKKPVHSLAAILFSLLKSSACCWSSWWYHGCLSLTPVNSIFLQIWNRSSVIWLVGGNYNGNRWNLFKKGILLYSCGHVVGKAQDSLESRGKKADKLDQKAMIKKEIPPIVATWKNNTKYYHSSRRQRHWKLICLGL